MIPCCFHPTRVVIVDDQHELAAALDENLPTAHMTFEFFSDPQKALQYVNEIYQSEPFYNRYEKKEQDRSCKKPQRDAGNTFDIYYEIYRPQRFEEISTVVIEHTSSGLPLEMTGLDFFKNMQNPHIQKILLIEEGKEQIAAQALKEGIIHYYLCKYQDFTWEDLFNDLLQQAQWAYFTKLSEVFMKTTWPHEEAHPAIVDVNFQNFFKAILATHSFTEAYLCEATGSYLFLDEQAQDHGLVVNIAAQLDVWVRTGQAKGINMSLLKALKDRKKMMCYHATQENLEPDKKHWEIYAHPVNKLKGQNNTFYYAFGPNMYDIDLERILPFEVYRESQQRRTGQLH